MAELEKYHWLHGIDEYLTRTNHIHSSKYQTIQKAVQYGEPWPIRDMVLQLIKDGNNESSEEFTNIILAHHLTELELTNEQVLRFIIRYVDDGFLLDTYAWIQKYENRADLAGTQLFRISSLSSLHQLGCIVLTQMKLLLM